MRKPPSNPHRLFASASAYLLLLALVVFEILSLEALAQVDSGTKQSARFDDLPLAARTKISTLLGDESRGYHVRAESAGFELVNLEHHLTAHFTLSGVELSSGDVRWNMSLYSYGYGSHMKKPQPASPHAQRNRVEYRRNALIEWYVNGPMGLEQGFTLSQPPRGQTRGTGPLTLVLKMEGDLRKASLDRSARALRLATHEGNTVLSYSGLTAYDSNQRELRTSLEFRDNLVFLEVDDSAASYPLVVDPWVQLAELTPSDAITGNLFGYSVSVYSRTVVVGAPDPSGNGAAYVFVEPTNGWSTMTETAKLTASDGAFNDHFGHSVAVSGNTVVVSAPYKNSGQGAVYIFVEPTNGWATMTETAKLTASDGAPGDNFGWSVTVSGNVATVGAPGATIGSNSAQGAAYVFVKPPSGWATTSIFKAKLIASDGAAGDYLATSISLAGDTLVAGAATATIGSNSKQGAAYVFVKPATGWSTGTQTAKLTTSDGLAGDRFGWSVGTTGTTIVAGAPFAMVGSNSAQGAAYVFVIPTTGWADMTQTAKLTPSHGTVNELFGVSVGASGNSVVAGAPFAFGPNHRQGAAYVFVKPSTGWTTTSSSMKLVASDGANGDEFGGSVGISGSTVLSGSIGGSGAAYVFQRQP